MGALGGAQCHGQLAEQYPTPMFLGFSVVLLLAWLLAREMFAALAAHTTSTTGARAITP